MELLAMMRTPSDSATKPGRVVLYYDESNCTPFITWWEADDGGRCWGHYFFEEKNARVDFFERCKHMFHFTGKIGYEGEVHLNVIKPIPETIHADSVG